VIIQFSLDINAQIFERSISHALSVLQKPDSGACPGSWIKSRTGSDPGFACLGTKHRQAGMTEKSKNQLFTNPSTMKGE